MSIPIVLRVKSGVYNLDSGECHCSNMAMLEMQAEKLFSDGDYEGALKTFTEITGSGGALLRWSDEEKFEAVRARQAACSLALAHSLARSGQQIAAIKGYSDTLALHSDSMSKDDIIEARLRRDECLLHHLRASCDAEGCSQVLRCVQRGVEVSRPSIIDSGMWAAWRKKDKNLWLLLLEARIEQLRDYKTGSPTFRVGKDKFESVLRWCNQLLVPNPADPAPQSSGSHSGGGNGNSVEVGLKDLKELSTEVLLWMAAAEFALASSGNTDVNVAACHDALEYVEKASKYLDKSADSSEGVQDLVATSQRENGDLLNGCLGNRNRVIVSDELSAVVKLRLEELEKLQMQRAVEQEQVQRVLEQQRRLEEEAKTMKKKEAEERQRKAREERQRKEMEKRQQQQLDKEEAVRKKAEEAAAKKREAEAAAKKREAAQIQEELMREKREEEERIKAEAAERALTEAIQEAQARRLQQEKEKEKEKQKEKDKETEKEKEKEKAARELKAKAAAPSGSAAKGKGAGTDVRVSGGGDAGSMRQGSGQEGVTSAAVGVGGNKRAGDGVKKVEKQDVGQMIQRVDDLVAAGNHEQVVEEISRLLSTQVRYGCVRMQVWAGVRSDGRAFYREPR